MDQNPRIPSKAFSALNGKEIVDILCKQLRDSLEGDENFQQHLTYPVVEATWKLEFRSYPGRNSRIPIEVEVPMSAKMGGELPELQDPIVGEHKGEIITDTPDEERIKHDLPVTRPEMVNGRFVDVPTIEKPATEIPRMDD